MSQKHNANERAELLDRSLCSVAPPWSARLINLNHMSKAFVCLLEEHCVTAQYRPQSVVTG